MPAAVLRALIAALLVACVAMAGVGAIAAERMPDISQCRGNDGYVYIALGRDILRWKPDRFIIMDLSGADTDPLFPAPPDASEPAGCHDNPLRVLRGSPVLELSELVPGATDSSGRGVHAFLILRLENDDLQQQREKSFERACEPPQDGRGHRIRTIDPPGFSECSTQSAKDPATWLSSYKTLPGRYTAPMGGPLVITCLYSGLFDCYTGYKMAPTLGLTYLFNFSELALEQLLDFDRALQAKIEAARVKDYAWPAP
ncbi:hypothetical protein FRZ61_20630 [Hypericibacter adhaerens]|uniref:Uncharacterized protein n=1 Tax=Hypericibacter adhaerens TaxID=2602016 RepID=A0A5J6MYU9_9PROT|nr:hypothetical protein [Hypericibacter adhaerens]QEX22133.1 hypothetical protein FRZ61_20630 [Hypericibacter adhaerens]